MLDVKQTIIIKRECTTSDLCLIAILKMNNCKIIRWDKFENNKFTFVFEYSEELDRIVKEYYKLSFDQHPLKKFYNELKEVKNIIYNN
jgi:hypothetical protein